MDALESHCCRVEVGLRKATWEVAMEHTGGQDWRMENKSKIWRVITYMGGDFPTQQPPATMVIGQ